MITYGSTTLTSYNTITKIEVYYYKSTSSTDLAGGSWSTTKPTWENGKYIWQKIRTTYEGKLANGQFYSESDPVNITGQQGKSGEAASSYKLTSSESVIVLLKTGEYSTNQVTFSATYKQGNNPIAPYDGGFIIQYSINDAEWVTDYTSLEDESSKTYTVPENVLIIKCLLYQTKDCDELLDIVTVPIIKDGIDGTGVTNSFPIYLVSDKDKGITLDDHGWTRFRPSLDAENKYLWIDYISRYAEGNIKPQLIEKTGNKITFEHHGERSPFESVIIDITPVQSGSGTPSSGNIRHISGWTSIDIGQADINLMPYEEGKYMLDLPEDIGTLDNQTLNLKNTMFTIQGDTLIITKGDLGTHITFPEEVDTVYGGKYNVTTGVLMVTHGYIDKYNNEPLPSTWISDRNVYIKGTKPSVGAQVVFELNEPLIYELTPHEIMIFEHSNSIYASTGDISISYYDYQTTTSPYIDYALVSAFDASTAALEETTQLKQDFQELQEDIQTQLDQKVETWCQINDPALSWSTTELKQQHNGDLWYYIGKSNMTYKNNTTYKYVASTGKWMPYAVSADLFDQIDGKAQVFINTPTPPYQTGDIWFNSGTSEIMTCIADRANGSYTASDWEKRNKYTDDTKANTANTKVDNLKKVRLGWKVNYDAFATTNNGECYFHGYDSNNAPADVDGKVEWNGADLTITKGMWINPNAAAPYNIPILHVFRTNTSPYHADVWWNESLKKWQGYMYTTGHTPGTVSDWIWNETTDCILATYIEPNSENAIQSAQLFNPPKKFSEINDPSLVYEVEQKIDGIEVGGRNLWKDSSLTGNISEYTYNAYWDKTIKDGYECLHYSGQLGKSYPLGRRTTIPDFTPWAGLKMIISCDVLLENITRGTTNYFVGFYMNGQTIDEHWTAPVIIKSQNLYGNGTNFDYVNLPDKGWQRAYLAFEFGDYNWSIKNWTFMIYNRDFTGDLYIKNVKVEFGNVPTDWTPAPEDTDASIQQAKKSATNYMSSDNTGIMVADMTDGVEKLPSDTTLTGSNVFITAGYGSGNTAVPAGVHIRDGKTDIARFGTTIKIGGNDNTYGYLYEDYHSLQMIDRNENNYFYISDLRNSNGVAQLTEVFYGNGIDTQFELSFTATSRDYTVVTSDSSVPSIKQLYGFSFENAPAQNVKITVTYESDSQFLKAYTLGKRANSSNIGAYSFAEGYNIKAEGNFSHAEGYQAKASGYCAHAEGSTTTAEGWYSHAEGIESQAMGMFSHAEGYSEARGSFSHAQNETIAQSSFQTTLGKHNIIDNDEKYPFIIGNGSDYYNARSNALTVSWDGDIKIDTTFRQNGSIGSVDIALYNAITALGWEGDVIV